jgi:predicted lipid-binding transport protein (Tim44 family)
MSDASENKSSLIWGAILIGLGALFLLDNLHILDFGDVVSNLWPLILIAIGLRIVWSARKENEEQRAQPTTGAAGAAKPKAEAAKPEAAESGPDAGKDKSTD